MQGTAADFRLYHSNSLQVLAGLLAEELKRPAPGQDLLAPDIVLVPQAAMKRWLQAELAHAHGIAANLEFLPPGEFVARALQHNLRDNGDAFDTPALHWRLYAALRDPALMRKPAMQPLRDYLAGDDSLKPWALAAELAATFEKYQAWRRDWLLQWETGADRDDPQASLWRHIARAAPRHRARRIDEYLERFAAPGADPPQGLPPRLFVFATLNVSPDVLRVIATQARAGTLHFYLPSPTREFWGDLQTLKEKLRAGLDPFGEGDDDNPLLRDWGAAGRDFMAVLGGYEVVHPTADFPAYAAPPSDSLLHRLQSDLFHRNAKPAAQRKAIEQADLSLQVHACHTRLREVQVLHDQLRALLDDERFDPPLQPREIAVLAPDIDPYLPYVEAVFGGRRGHADFIPYTVADASPLASEPVADLFLRLLQLPVSRFGLHEILDLLASPALAGNGGLAAAELDQLQSWLRDAGARWGINAEHRAQAGAPRDDAGTWAFAIDRLLLGHASGDEADIAGVAPWPRLEGSALDALDQLLRMLRLLARQQKLLGEAAPPAQWRKRLLALLDALFPRQPRDDDAQRALERLRKHVDEFAKGAANAGFDGEVPAEAVRAHFAGILGEADTRAPLMSGGVGFGRMVPLRLLPFRVICVLGMNDGEYPRRDPSAGLNRLATALGTPERRAGDRSLRDDDRYLFLQLFAAAQDVFYLSYLGADPRDGSAREPSPLVAELLAVAKQHHADVDGFGKRFVVRHPLQPFSPEAFGEVASKRHDDETPETRRFSYRGEWRPAAAGTTGARQPLPRWFDVALPAPKDMERELSLDELKRFLLDPAGRFLSQRLGLRLPDEADTVEDVEPLQVAARGLEGWALKKQVFEALLAGVDRDDLYARLRARALVPSGEVGRRGLRKLVDDVAPYAAKFTDWRGEARSQSLPIDIGIDGWKLRGDLADAYPQGIARVRIGGRNGTSWVRHGIDRLAAAAQGIELPLVEFVEDDEGGIGPHVLEPFDREQAKQALAALLDLRERGLRAPLQYGPRSGWAYYSEVKPERARQKAENQWYGGEYIDAESASPSIRLALRGADPFAGEEVSREFAETAYLVFEAVCAGTAFAGFAEAEGGA